MTFLNLKFQKLGEREAQLEMLSSQLSEATEQIESHNRLIASLQAALNLTESPEKTEALIKSLKTSNRRLEEALGGRDQMIKELEKEAETASRKLTFLDARLSEYEKGEYGLPQAVAEIKDLKNQLRIR